MSVKLIVQILIIIWVIVASLYIFIPAYNILEYAGTYDPVVIPEPLMPDPPQKLDTTKNLSESEVKIYQEQIKAYSLKFNLYSTIFSDSIRSKKIQVYESVVNKTFISLIEKIFIVLIPLIFINLGAQVFDNYVRVKNGKPPERLRMFP